MSEGEGANAPGEPLTPDQAAVFKALADLGHEVWGAPALRLIAALTSHPAAAQAMKLRINAADFRRIKTVVGAVDVLVECTGRLGAPPVVDKCPMCFTLTPGGCFDVECPRRSDG
ncbi:MAG TPA: hypothetical protein VFN61_03150 [Acidimicrobiales bacterium]|nr:hypothetical protein [Acidimicrobiales bacterium]